MAKNRPLTSGNKNGKFGGATPNQGSPKPRGLVGATKAGISKVINFLTGNKIKSNFVPKTAPKGKSGAGGGSSM